MTFSNSSSSFEDSLNESKFDPLLVCLPETGFPETSLSSLRFILLFEELRRRLGWIWLLMKLEWITRPFLSSLFLQTGITGGCLTAKFGDLYIGGFDWTYWYWILSTSSNWSFFFRTPKSRQEFLELINLLGKVELGKVVFDPSLDLSQAGVLLKVGIKDPTLLLIEISGAWTPQSIYLWLNFLITF